MDSDPDGHKHQESFTSDSNSSGDYDGSNQAGHELVGEYSDESDRELSREHLPTITGAECGDTELRVNPDGEIVTATVEVNLATDSDRWASASVAFTIEDDVAYPVGIAHNFPSNAAEIDLWHLNALPFAAAHLRETTSIDRVISPTDYLRAMLGGGPPSEGSDGGGDGGDYQPGAPVPDGGEELESWNAHLGGEPSEAQQEWRKERKEIEHALRRSDRATIHTAYGTDIELDIGQRRHDTIEVWGVEEAGDGEMEYRTRLRLLGDARVIGASDGANDGPSTTLTATIDVDTDDLDAAEQRVEDLRDKIGTLRAEMRDLKLMLGAPIDDEPDNEPIPDGGENTSFVTEDGPNASHHSNPDGGMDRVTVRMPDHLLDAIDGTVDDGEFHTRSQAVRHACRQVFGGEEPEVATDGGRTKCLDCGHAYDREQFDKCPACTHHTFSRSREVVSE